MFSFTLEQLVDEVRKLAKENPDNNYNNGYQKAQCFYNKGECSNGTIGCLFGQAMKRLGVSDDQLNGFGSKPIRDILRENRVKHNENLFSWCEDVQMSQDDGLPWGKCVE